MLVMLMCMHITSAAPSIDREINRAQGKPGCRKILLSSSASRHQCVYPGQGPDTHGLNVLLLMHRSTKD